VKMPLLPWLYLVVSGLVLLGISSLTAAQIMLLLDRFLGAHFFDTQAGGSAVLWMHFFGSSATPRFISWLLPVFAFASEIIPVFSRKAIFGYPVMVRRDRRHRVRQPECVGAIIFLAVGMTSTGNTFFAISTMLVAVPTGMKSSNWIGTMWGGKLRFAPALLFSIGFLAQFLIAV